MSVRLFIGASILTIGLLIQAGAPLLPLLLGVGLAAAFTWTRQRS